MQIHQALPITFVTEENRTFRATFFDVAGRSTTRDVTVRLQCNGIAACSAVCVDLSTSSANCGACGNALPPEAGCSGGVPKCIVNGLTYCAASKVCTNLMADASNCGACGNTVPAPRFCIDGAPKCNNNLDYCASSNTCSDHKTDASNCGGCGIVVTAPRSCVGGVPTCPLPGQSFCPGTNVCTDLLLDSNNCGACGNVCAAKPLATGICNGSCDIQPSTSTRTNCSTLCSGMGLICDKGGFAVYAGVSGTVPVDCSTTPSATQGDPLFSFSSLSCVCR
jgi:hypothetical protein